MLLTVHLPLLPPLCFEVLFPGFIVRRENGGKRINELSRINE